MCTYNSWYKYILEGFKALFIIYIFLIDIAHLYILYIEKCIKIRYCLESCCLEFE